MKPMTALAAAMQHAGMNIAASRLWGMALDAFKKHHGNVDRALKTLEKDVGSDRDLIREALRIVLEQLSAEGHHVSDAHSSVANGRQPHRGGEGQNVDVNHSPIAHPIREPSAAQTDADLNARTRAALSVFDRELTHSGRMWGNVTYRELDALVDDGSLAQHVKEHIGQLRGDERHKMVRDLMTPREFYGVLRKAGRSAHAA